MPVAILLSPRPFRHAALLLVFISGITIHGAHAQGNSCLPFTDTQKVKIIAYISKWMAVPEMENLEIEGDELVPGTCYRKLAVKGRTLLPRPFFLSPDQRFLSGSLLDVTIDPMQERKQAQEGIFHFKAILGRTMRLHSRLALRCNRVMRSGVYTIFSMPIKPH
jgi:hypothetical protein